MTQYEEEFYKKGIIYIAGVDEAGRGPLAGPVIAACVVLPKGIELPGIKDSKKLSEKKRESFFEIITEKSLAAGIGIADNIVIDEINILEATKLAMKQAICEALQKLQKCHNVADTGIETAGSDSSIREAGKTAAVGLLIDALTLSGIELPQTGIIKGDEKSISIAAASIIAKVTRDNMMKDFHKKYPQYGFDKHKGYGTKAHYEAVYEHGLCEIHRKSFLKNCDFSHKS